MTLSELQALERDYLMPTYARNPVEFVRGQGSKMWDSEGNEYLDFLSGIAVVSLGHTHPGIVDAISKHAGQLMHTTSLYYTEPALKLAKRISESSLGGKVFFCNSGAEAAECAIKLARRHRPHGGFVVLEGAFHGRTMGALSATPQPAKQEPFEPLVPGFQSVPRDDVEALRAAVGADTAGVLIEPIQGEDGIHSISPEMLKAAREACDATGALLIFDEVQCGMGRTGHMWAWQGLGVKPDVMTSAKGLGGGVPIGACVTTPEFGDTFKPGDHGSTFPGGPMIAAAAHAVFDVIDDEAFLASVKTRGERLRAGLDALPVTNIDGAGLMWGFDVAEAPDLSRSLLMDHRLVVNATGPERIRLLPALTVSEAEIDDALARLAEGLAAAS
ncbi:MAG: acetylornithine/N-succinyldiaminopimelate aminotransferase [Thermoleophilaceae bacterium]|nr:acetylornithine/N-succinyldiaminopimelate aminotransferase [Thermoleophilaceae bacterium]